MHLACFIMNLLNTPFRVFKEARRKGDTETMKRAMGYVNEFSDKTDEYKAKADKGMKEEAEEARKKAKLECEKMIQKRKEEREELEKRTEESRDKNKETDTVYVSEEGKVLLKDNVDPDRTGSDEIKIDVVKEPVTYTKTGETVSAEQEASISVSV